MVAWLDRFVTDDLIKTYVASADAGQVEVFYYLDRFRPRGESSRGIKSRRPDTNIARSP
jgi:hypothetical protein